MGIVAGLIVSLFFGSFSPHKLFPATEAAAAAPPALRAAAAVGELAAARAAAPVCAPCAPLAPPCEAAAAPVPCTPAALPAPPACSPAALPAPPAPPPPPPAPAGLSFTPGYAISSLMRTSGVLTRTTASTVSHMATLKHPRYNAIVDAGAFDGVDYTLPAYRAGYDVFVFELSPRNQENLIGQLKGGGLAEGRDFSIIRPAPPYAPPPRAAKSPHVYVFFAGVSDASRPAVVRRFAGMADAGEGEEVAPAGTMCATCLPTALVAIDDVVPEWARLWILKLDTQGHEPYALAGAARTVRSGRTRALALEWWPAGIVAQGIADGGVAALTALYDIGARCFDLGSSEGNKIATLMFDRPSGLKEWTQAHLDAPRNPPPGGDPIGAWDDLFCTLGVADGAD